MTDQSNQARYARDILVTRAAQKENGGLFRAGWIDERAGFPPMREGGDYLSGWEAARSSAGDGWDGMEDARLSLYSA